MGSPWQFGASDSFHPLATACEPRAGGHPAGEDASPMSRSGYTDDWPEDNSGGLYRGAVKSAIKGRRGQAFLKEMLADLDAMPIKELIAGDLGHGGSVCAIGAVARARGIDMTKLDSEDAEGV